jgi:hypothetical protein
MARNTPVPRAGTWSQQELTASDGALLDRFGYSVALSADGSTALVADWSGAAYVFVWSSGGWHR